MKKSKIIPRGKNVLILPQAEKSRESEFGIILPTNVEQEKKSIGEVLAIGKEVKEIKIGEKVIYGLYLGEHIKMQEGTKEVEYIILHEDDIIASLL